jgi:hypothetical protein
MSEYNVLEYQTGFSGVDYSLVASSLGKTFSTSEQSLISNYISMVESYIISQTNRQFKVFTNDDYYFQKGFLKDKFLNFKAIPVGKLKSIYFDNNLVYENNVSGYTINSDFYLTENFIEFSDAIYNENKNKEYKVVFQINKFYGDDIKLAVLTAVQEMFLMRDYGQMDIKNVSLNGFNFSLGNRFNILKEVINKYQIKFI